MNFNYLLATWIHWKHSENHLVPLQIFPINYTRNQSHAQIKYRQEKSLATNIVPILKPPTAYLEKSTYSP